MFRTTCIVRNPRTTCVCGAARAARAAAPHGPLAPLPPCHRVRSRRARPCLQMIYALVAAALLAAPAVEGRPRRSTGTLSPPPSPPPADYSTTSNSTSTSSAECTVTINASTESAAVSGFADVGALPRWPRASVRCAVAAQGDRVCRQMAPCAADHAPSCPRARCVNAGRSNAHAPGRCATAPSAALPRGKLAHAAPSCACVLLRPASSLEPCGHQCRRSTYQIRNANRRAHRAAPCPGPHRGARARLQSRR